MKKVTAAVLIIIIFCFAQCKKTPLPNNTSEMPGLPPATQTGANTLGFLLNGVPWVPAGPNNLSVDYDPGFNNGILGLAASRKIFNLERSLIIIGLDSLNSYPSKSFFKVGFKQIGGIIFSDSSYCQSASDIPTNYSIGEIAITKLDRIGKIISGNFYCTLFNPICGDTIKITNGRFDMKF